MAKKKRKQKREPTVQEAYAKFVREARKVWLYPSKTFDVELRGSVAWTTFNWNPGDALEEDEVLVGVVPFHKAKVKAKKDTLHASRIEVTYTRMKCLDVPVGPGAGWIFTVDLAGTPEEDEEHCKRRLAEFARDWLIRSLRQVGRNIEREQQS